MSTLDQYTAPGEPLDDLESYEYGDRTRWNQIKGNTPFCWVIQAPHTPETTSMNSEQHEFKFLFAFLVLGNDPREAIERSEEIMTRGYDVFSADRDRGEVVQDSFPGELRWGLEFPKGNNAYWSGFEWLFRVRKYRQAYS